MPKIFVPHKSGAHRLACTSLYRALLKQCDDLSATTASAGLDLPSSALQDLVRYRFRRDRKLKSPTHIRDALTHAHARLSILHEVNVGSRSALTQLLKILKTTVEEAESTAAETELQQERQLPPKITAKALHNQRQSSKALHQPPPDAVGLAGHPLPLSALKSESRIVPQLINAQKNIPFLRYGKQSVYMSRIIRQRMEWKELAYSQLKSLEVKYNLGLSEDEWDKAIQNQIFEEIGPDEARKLGRLQPSWGLEAKKAQDLIYARIREKDKKAAELGLQMWGIVKQEQRLKNWEDLPINVAKAIKNIRKLEVRVHQFTQKHETKYQFQVRPHNIPITDEVECKQMGRLEIPVEYAKREEDSSPKYYAELEQRLSNRPWSPTGGKIYRPSLQMGGRSPQTRTQTGCWR